MAQEDDRPLPQPRGPPPGAVAPPDHVDKPHVYEIFPGSKPEDRDGTLSNVPSDEQQPARRPTISDGIKTIKSEDFLKVHEIPCARQGLMTGIGAGFVVGFGRYLTGARIPKAANWAAASFMLGSVIQFEVCQYQREAERKAMARAVEIIDRKQAEKKTKADEVARLRAEAIEKAKQAEQKSWYKFW
ncbi:hypothetical protein SCAR479_01507 [Seiridium cardinale]|uniref:Cytochrome c oxidase assembly protein COX20, mitochondrial n=1 Tax=Seiridium cardinale TaxID=138064 RepID=A0ABR2Y5M3_9PEZI